MQTRYTEQNYPLFRFLHWDRSLIEHPEFRKFAGAIARGKHPHAPFLEYAEDEKPTMDARDVREAIMSQWGDLQPSFSSKVEIISRRFFLAMVKSYSTFGQLDLFRQVEGRFSGTFVLPDSQAICYDFVMKNPFLSDDGRLCYSCFGSAVVLDSDGNTLLYALTDKKAYHSCSGVMDRQDPLATGIMDLVIVLHLFKKYADVQISDAQARGVRPSSKPEVRTVLDGVSYLDATWYTTAIHEGDFTVSGHFRLQPCGPGRKERKLIFINEFQKHGYVRRARMLDMEANDGKN